MSAEPTLTETFVDPATATKQRLLELQLQVLDTHAEEQQMPNPLVEVGRYALAAPGKMLRGRLLLESFRAVAGDTERVLWAAAGTEFGHLASLIHDDVIDRDDMRRGRESVWGRYGGDAAIIGADLFIFEAYYCLSLCRGKVPSDLIVRALEVTSKSCIDLCLGQALESVLTGNCSATADQYWAVVRGKTASLFRGACESGTILGGGTERQISAMRSFGESLGLAFQVVDDLLPYTGRDGTLGKRVASDVRNRRVTLPVVYALEADAPADVAAIRSIFEADPAEGDPDREHREVTRILERTGALGQAEAEAERLYRQALGHLFELPPSPGRDALASTAARAVHRTS